MSGRTGPLRVAVHATDPVRRAGLLSLLAEGGHAPEAADNRAEALVWDLRPGEALPPAGAPPLVLLADRPDLERDPRFPAVLPRAVAPGPLLAALGAVAAGLVVRLQAAELPESGFQPAEEAGRFGLLTPREVDILRAVGDGLSNKEVARRLGISAHTVKFHLEAIFEKLGAGSRAEAVAKGLRRGVIEL
jgi:two-component system, NarL family, nitrate/nitrite response regulator NarL